MELCQGDITKKDHVLWNVTLAEAIEWGEFLVKRRFEWLEIINRIFGETEPEEGSEKKCRNATICSMCRKPCNQRLQ